MRICSSVLFYTKKEVFRYYNSHPNFLVNKFVSGIDNGANLELADKYSIPYNFASRVPSILFIGRNSPKACFPLLLDALSLIDNVSFSLNIIGFDALSYSSALSSHNIIFHGPLINEEHIASIINSCFLFVYPGSVGLSLLHSMAYRLPSLIHSTRDHHMPEADAASTDTSFFFEEGNCASLANALLDAYSRPSCCTSKSAASYQTVNNSFNLNTMSANFLTHLSVFHDFDNL